MYKGIVSAEELAELFARREISELQTEEARPDAETVQQAMVIHFLQDAVRQLTREVAELRARIADLENARPPEERPVAVLRHADQDAREPTAESDITLSRVERYRSKRKWF